MGAGRSTIVAPLHQRRRAGAPNKTLALGAQPVATEGHDYTGTIIIVGVAIVQQVPVRRWLGRAPSVAPAPS